MPKRKTEILSVFGQIEEAAAEHLIKKYPDQIKKIPKTLLAASKEDCPNIWTNSSGVEVSFAIAMPSNLCREYRETVARLRM